MMVADAAQIARLYRHSGASGFALDGAFNAPARLRICLLPVPPTLQGRSGPRADWWKHISPSSSGARQDPSPPHPHVMRKRAERRAIFSNEFVALGFR